jgi:hypothetical protein
MEASVPATSATSDVAIDGFVDKAATRRLEQLSRNVPSSAAGLPVRSSTAPPSPIGFPDLGETERQDGDARQPRGESRELRGLRTSDSSFHLFNQPAQRQLRSDLAGRPVKRGASTSPQPLETVHEETSPGGTDLHGYTPFPGSPPPPSPLPRSSLFAAESAGHRSTMADVMEAAASETAADVLVARLMRESGDMALPITDWVDVKRVDAKSVGKRCVGGIREHAFHVMLDSDAMPSSFGESLLSSVGCALRADSPDAPSTHADAMERDKVSGTPIWAPSESKEIGNHKHNVSWKLVPWDSVPRGRRIHKMIWVYKTKRDGTAKARLCVQGTTLEAGVDYDQVFSAALRYSSARALFAYAARHGCKVRSADLVAAYLQGRFLEGETVYCKQPVGHEEYDEHGRPLIAKVLKPIYGIQQSGRRLQRDLFSWFKKKGFRQLDDSDPCIWILDSSSTSDVNSSERIAIAADEILVVGIYVDNLQIVHSANLNSAGRGPSGCAYNEFMDQLAAAWDVTDEGPMHDLLGIEVEYNDDDSIKLHQKAYVEKIVQRFMPDGPLPKCQRNGMPYSPKFLLRINHALSNEPCHPELVRLMQQIVGCLMYACTSTRPDIAYPVHQLCQCLQRPTPDLIDECNHVLSYLARTSDFGLTYTREHQRLTGYSDASWETHRSTSGWVVLWQSAALSWGSRKQKCTALSTCEAEIIALSEATKDVVYLRKLVHGYGDTEPGPTDLYTDSKSARDVSYNPEHHDKMKHVARDESACHVIALLRAPPHALCCGRSCAVGTIDRGGASECGHVRAHRS